MDQEKFDQHLMDYLFDELDEVTRAAMKRKIESDADCRELEAGLRATIDVAQVPYDEPDDDLEERILAAASAAHEREPWTRKLLRSLSWAGSHAMRPQLAMAAILMLVLGSSMLLLRVRSGAVSITPSKDPERTAAVAELEPDMPPALEREQKDAPRLDGSAAASSVPSTPKTAPIPSGGDSEEDAVALDKLYERAMANYNAGKLVEAQADFAELQRSKSKHAASAAFYEARSIRANSGCQAAIPYFSKVRSQYGASGVSADATWEQADCHRILGQMAQARELWLTLKGNKSYQSRVNTELENQGESANAGGEASQSGHRGAPQPQPQAPQPQP